MDNTIILSNYELWFLLSQLSPNAILGFKNPMPGLVREDMFPLVQEATFSLVDKDLIHVDSGNLIKISEPLNSYISTIADDDTTVLIGLRLNNDKSHTIQSCHFTANQTIFMETLTEYEYRISKITSKEELISLISLPFNSNVFWAPDSKELHFTQHNLKTMQQNVEDGYMDRAKELLDATEGDPESKLHFFNTLQNPIINFSFVVFLNQNDVSQNHVDGFAIICDERYIWILEEVDEKKQIIRVAKITSKDFYKKIATKTPWIPRSI